MASTAPFLTIAHRGLSAQMEILPDGVAFVAPVTFNGIVICHEGYWAYGISPNDAVLLLEALDDCVTGILMGNCAPAPELNRLFDSILAAA